jgi:hypothetical protein
MAEILKVNTDSLQTHMKRTELNESRIYMVEEQNLKNQSFIKGSIWTISIMWAVILAGLAIYLKL